MDSEKAVSINFTDLTDVPDSFSGKAGLSLIVNDTCTGLYFASNLKGYDILADGCVDAQSLNVHKETFFYGQANCKAVNCTSLNVIDLNGQKILTDTLEATSSKIKNVVSENVESILITNKGLLKTDSLESNDIVASSLRVDKSITLPPEIICKDLSVDSLKSVKSVSNELVSSIGSIDTLTSKDLLVNTLKVGSALCDSVNAACLDSDFVVAEKIHIRTSQKEGCKELPIVKDVLEGTLLPQISSKYIWYGKLKTPVNNFKFKVRSVMDVLGDYSPVVAFHPYETPVRLADNFKVDTFITPDEADSFIINLSFNNNLPATTKFVLSVVLNRI